MLYVSPDGVHVVRSAVMGVALVWTYLDMMPTCTGFRACKQKGKPLCKTRRTSLLNAFRPCSCHSAVQKAHLGGSDGLWDLGCFVVVPTRELMQELSLPIVVSSCLDCSWYEDHLQNRVAGLAQVQTMLEAEQASSSE